MTPRSLIPAALLPALFLASCHTQPDLDLSTPPAPVAGYSETDVFWGIFEDRALNQKSLYIAGQPSEHALRRLAAEGVTTVVNLRTPAEMNDRSSVPYNEAAAAHALGINYVVIPVNGSADFPYTPEAVDTFADAVESARGKVLLHCRSAGRASHLWAAYLARHKGVPPQDAYARARAINLQPSVFDRFMGLDTQTHTTPDKAR